METIVKKLYEAMFLVDSTEAADWDAVITAIKNILEKAEAEIVSIKKWDERKLAYEINGKTRGTYILCYFRAEGGRIQDIERDVQLSERIMRVLILSTEGRALQDIEKDIAENLAEDREAEAVQAGEDIETNTAETPGEDRLVEAAQEPEVDQVSADDGRISD